MDTPSLKSLLENFKNLSILVLGDFFLDRYLMIDPAIREISIETGLETRQVVEIQNSPGAAGTVTNNLRALGVGNVVALGVIGEDGHGYDLQYGLEASGVDTSHLITSSDRYTPTYTKPIDNSTGKEMERFDVKNRTSLPRDLEAEIIEKLSALYQETDGVIVLDQVQEADCGVVTSVVRNKLSALCESNDRPVLADSRAHISRFRNVILKSTEDEILSLVSDTSDPNDAASELCARTDRPLILTRGPEGITAFDGSETITIPGIPVPDPIDSVGAGDSVSASVTSALAVGASLPDAALLGVIVSSITIQQIGTTGTATHAQILSRYQEIS